MTWYSSVTSIQQVLEQPQAVEIYGQVSPMCISLGKCTLVPYYCVNCHKAFTIQKINALLKYNYYNFYYI